MTAFSGSVHAFVHPGIYMRELSARQLSELDRQMHQNPSLGLLQRLYDPTNSNPINLGNLGASLPQGFQEKIFWTLEKDLTEPYYRDRVNHSAALEFLKKIPKPLSEFTLQEFHVFLCTLYQKILDPSQRAGENFYRKEATAVSKNNLTWQESVKYLQEKSPTQADGFRLLGILRRLESEPWDEIKKALSEKEITAIEGLLTPCPLPREIPGLIEQFHRDLVQKFRTREDLFAIAGFAHMRLAKIHPFTDGNGRIARLVMNLILMQAGYSPIAFASDVEYTAALKKGEIVFIRLIKKTVAQFEYEEVVDLLLKKKKETFEKTLRIAQQLFDDPFGLRIFRVTVNTFSLF